MVFIHSSVKGHLSYFHVLPIVNSAAMNIVYTLFVLCFLSDVGAVRGPAGDRGHIHRGSWWWCPEGALYKNGKDLKETNKDSETRENASCRKACKKVATVCLCPWDFPREDTGVRCGALLQGIFPTQGSNPGLPHYRRILYCLSHQGSLCSRYREVLCSRDCYGSTTLLW